MNIDDWIEIAEREVDQRVSSARIAAINEDGRAHNSCVINLKGLAGTHLYVGKSNGEIACSVIVNLQLEVSENCSGLAGVVSCRSITVDHHGSSCEIESIEAESFLINYRTAYESHTLGDNDLELDGTYAY